MNKTNTILIHWSREQKIFKKNLLLLKKKPGKTEAIHELRVAIKKLTAYLHLYALLQKETDSLSGKDEHLLTKTTELFEITGRQRDVEICIELTGELIKEDDFSYSNIRRFLKAILKVTSTWSADAVHHYRNKELPKIKSLLKQDSQLDNAEIVNEKIESNVNKQLAGLPSFYRKPHLLRINLKSVYYAINLLQDKEKYQPVILDRILEDLGSWQDLEVFSGRCKHFRKDYLPKPFDENEILKELQSVVDLKKQVLMKNVRIQLKAWLKNVALPVK